MNAIARWSAGVFAGLALAIAGPADALAQQAGIAGSFVRVTGDVKILGGDGVMRAAATGDAFREGESILTGADGLAQLRMSDGSALSVRTASRFRLDRYGYEGKEDRDPSFFVSLVKGGFRTVTGLISRMRRDNYRVTTPVAALGVRGTDFEIVHVEQPLPDAAAGTYDRVYEGVTALRNRAGVELLVSRGQTAFVALPGDRAPVLVAPPRGIFGESAAAPAPGQRSGNETESDTAAAPVLINPIDTPRTVLQDFGAPPSVTIAPGLTVPVTATLPSALDSSVTLSTSPALAAPVTATVGPADATLAPTLSVPVSATVSPTLTAPTTLTVSPTVSVPVTTSVGPITTTASPALSAPITVTASPGSLPTVSAAPALSVPVTSTIAPTVTAPVTTTIQNLSTTTGKLLGQ